MPQTISNTVMRISYHTSLRSLEGSVSNVTAVLLPWWHYSRNNEFKHKRRVGIDGDPGEIRTKHPLSTRQERYNFTQVPRCCFLIAQTLPQKSKSFHSQL